jgi:hypothetical protein
MAIDSVEGQGFQLSPQPDTFLVLEAVTMPAFATWNCVA